MIEASIYYTKMDVQSHIRPYEDPAMKKSRGEALQVATANALKSGMVVFRTADGAWSRDIDRAFVAVDAAAAQALLGDANADAEANLVVEPYLVDVVRNGPKLVPTRLRELIRAAGPTVPTPGSERLADAA
jgi:hypothetical protein